MATQETIDSMVRQLVEKFDPLRVVLFGSHARGDARADSDVDLLVVMPDGTNPRESAIAMLRELRHAPVAKDVVVATPDVLARLGGITTYIYRSALREGKVLYERR